MLMLFVVPVYAADASEELLTSWDIGDADGYKSNTSEVDEFFSESPQLTLSSANVLKSDLQEYNASQKAYLTDLVLSHNAGNVEISGTLTLNGSSYLIDSVGDYYRNEPTEHSANADNLIFCEFEDTEEIHFVQFRIDKDVPQIASKHQSNDSLVTIILQLVDTENLVQLQQGIDASVFDELYELEPAVQLEGDELVSKIISLYSVRNNLMNVPDDSVKQESFELGSQGTEQISTIATASATHNGWKNLINALNSNGSVALSNYSSSIDTSFFTGGGWKYNNGWNNGVGYSFSSYSVANGSSEYLVQFALLEHTTHSHTYNNADIWNTGLQSEYYDGLVARYTPYDGQLTVLYYSWGLTLNNLELSINKLTNSAFFINRYVDCSYVISGNMVRAALVLVPYVSTIADVFEYALETETNQTAESTQLFPDTYAGQIQLYGGNKIIRGLYATTGSNSLKASDHFINMVGNIKYNTSNGTEWTYTYKYLTYHNL
jgi:hypothetical protein